MSECPMCGFDDEALSDSGVENSVVCYRCVIEKAKAARGTTQVQTMTNQELNRKLAELMGYEVKDGHIGYLPTILVPREVSEDMHVWRYFDPCTDPAASLEVQTAAYNKSPIGFMRNIAEVQGWNAGARISIEEAGQLANPTLRERAEAAYITMQGGHIHVD